MLLRNGLIGTMSPLSLLGAGWQNFVQDTAVMNQSNAEGFTKLSSYSQGLYFPHCMIPPRTAGRMVSHDTMVGEGDVSDADVWAVKLAEAALTGSGDLTAVGSLIVQLVAAITGSGTVSVADLKAFLQLAAAISGSGVAAGTATGAGALLAALTGASSLSPTLTGTGALDADLVVTGTGLTTANVGEAVWSALAAANNTAGTMGEKLNDAGSAANPWTEVIESGYTAAEILRLIAAVAQGDASGLEGAAPVFKSIDGATDRVTATYSGGTRTITGRDAA